MKKTNLFHLTVFSGLLVLTGASLFASGSPCRFFPFLTNKIKDSLPTREALETERLAACAGLTLSDDEKREFKIQTDKLTSKQEWVILIDPNHILPPDYKPADMAVTANKKWPKKAQLRQEAMEQMNGMIAAAEKEGVTLLPISTYRTWQYQQGLYERNLARNGGKPSGYVARPGESQHHLGTAVDFNTVQPTDENIPALVWLRKHAGEYGFSLSFPKGEAAEKESGYPYEPWHYRYITREAVLLQDNFFAGDQHQTLAFLHNCIFHRK